MFLPHYNGVSLYDHRLIDVEFELDACLTGLGGRCGNCVYHLPMEKRLHELDNSPSRNDKHIAGAVFVS